MCRKLACVTGQIQKFDDILHTRTHVQTREHYPKLDRVQKTYIRSSCSRVVSCPVVLSSCVVSSCVVRSRVMSFSSSQCRLREAHACARLERRVGRVLRTLVGGHSITSISSALSLSRRFHRTFEQGTGTFHLVAQAASSLTSAIFPHARCHATV